MTEYNIILDDDLISRQTPEGFLRFVTGNDLIAFMHEHPNARINNITFDNDLGLGLPEGYDIVKTMVSENWSVQNINLHSANVVAVHNMKSFILSASKAGVFHFNNLSTYNLILYTYNLHPILDD